MNKISGKVQLSLHERKLDQAVTVAKQIKGIQAGDVTVNLFVASKEKGTFCYRRLPLESDLVNLFDPIINQCFENLPDPITPGTVIPFHFDRTTEEYEIEFADLTEADFAPLKPALAPLFSDIVLADLTRNESIDLGTKLRFYVIELQSSNDETIYLIRRYIPTTPLTRKGAIAAIFDTNGLRELKNPVLAFDGTIHAIIKGDLIFLLNKNQFFNALGFFEHLEKTAREALDDIHQVVQLDNKAQFDSLITTNHPARLKLARIARSPYFPDLTVDLLQKTLNNFPDLRIRICPDDNGAETLYWEEATTWDVLRLLGDDYLGSFMTGIKYEVNSKKII